jgi:hypothetical protein
MNNNVDSIQNLNEFKAAAEKLTSGLFAAIEAAKGQLSDEDLKKYEAAKKDTVKEFANIDKAMKKFK